MLGSLVTVNTLMAETPRILFLVPTETDFSFIHKIQHDPGFYQVPRYLSAG